jgi:hypothetical protein
MALALRWVFCTDIRTDSDFCFIHHWLIGFCNCVGKRLQRGTDWFLIYSRLRFVFKRLMNCIAQCTFISLYEDETDWLGHVTSMGEIWNTNRYIVSRPERKRQFRRSRYRWQDNTGSLFYLTTIVCHFLPTHNQISLTDSGYLTFI